MHLEIFTEDLSGAKLLEKVLPKMIGPNGDAHSWRTTSFHGIGRLPPNLRHEPHPRAKAILNKLPAILRAYGKMEAPDQRVVVLVDNDTKDCLAFKRELSVVADECGAADITLIRIAVQETEAWLLGDADAVATAYPKANKRRLKEFSGDAVHGNWEYLADAINAGDAKLLAARGYPELGTRKCEWAEKIGPALDPTNNRSESFKAFASGIMRMLTA